MPAAKRGARQRPSAGSRGDREDPKAIGANRPQIVIEPEDLSAYNESANILVHGNSGVGKTVLAGGACHSELAGRVVFLSTEKGTIAAKRTGSTAQLIRAYDWEHAEAGIEWADANLTDQDWLILDSATKMQKLNVRWILAEIRKEKPERDEDIPALQDHQKWQNMFTRYIDHIVDAQYNSIIVTTSMHKSDQEGDSLVLPSIQGKDYEIASYVAAQMDMVLYYAVAPQRAGEATLRRLLSETYSKADGPSYFAKDRFGVLDRWMDIEAGDYEAMGWIIDQVMQTAPEVRKAAKAATRAVRAGTADVTA